MPKLSPKENIDFVVKMIPENDPCRAYVFEAGLFEKENEMYFDLLPAIKFHCKKTLIQQSIPDCIYGSHNMDGAGKEGYELSSFIFKDVVCIRPKP